MSDTKHSETLVWVLIAVLGPSVIGAQLVDAGGQGKRPASGVAFRPRAPQVSLTPAFEIPAPSPTERVAEGPAASTVELFLEAIVQVESLGNPRCVGQAGERGLMQLKRAAWEEAAAMAFDPPPPYDQAFDPELNRRVGQAYLARLQDFLLANRSEWNADMRSLLAACYNAGPGRVEAADFAMQGLPRQTRRYVERVTALHDYYLANPTDQLYANRPASGHGS